MNRYPGDPFTVEDVVATRTADLEEQVRRLTRERDEYQSQVHTLTERVNNMTNAATGAAGTAEAALSRLIAAQPVLLAADAVVDEAELAVHPLDIPSRKLRTAVRALVDVVNTYRKGRPS